jgi:hypothetical protein
MLTIPLVEDVAEMAIKWMPDLSRRLAAKANNAILISPVNYAMDQKINQAAGIKASHEYPSREKWIW